jgi:hypothetical protein
MQGNKEMFDYIKGVIRNRKSMTDRQYNHDLQNTT